MGVFLDQYSPDCPQQRWCSSWEIQTGIDSIRQKDDKWLNINHVTRTQMVWQPVKTITPVDLLGVLFFFFF